MNVNLLGAVGLTFAVCFFCLTAWCTRRGVAGAPGTNTFAMAGGILAALALPTATGAFIMTLPIVSILAAVLINMSRIWENGGLRSTAYLLNSYCCVALAIALHGNSPEAMAPVNMLPAGILAGSLIYQYQWCRRWPPPEASKLFGGFDRSDRSALLLLMAGLVCSFFMIRIGLYYALSSLPANAQKDAFRCSQSVLINAAAIGLIMFAFLRRNREIRNVAILVTAVGGIKVFLYDLLGIHGLPLVFSIFSFGLAASIESLALGKWTSGPRGPDATKS
ncbi:MAG: DUF2339 domain-containing protein [Geobacter sp.]|nr:DUF2339 domain-containing protein [Geobacter sp.]